jgi:hypothetical protein
VNFFDVQAIFFWAKIAVKFVFVFVFASAAAEGARPIVVHYQVCKIGRANADV